MANNKISQEQETTDLFLKDEGEISTLCFQTKKALKIFDQQSDEFKEQCYGDETYRKIDIEAGQKNQLLAFAISHDLTFSND